MKALIPPAGFKRVRRDDIFEERTHDPYHPRGKLAEPAVCSECGAVYHDGRWRWGQPPEEPHEVLCPACARIRDHQPAGYLFIDGPFFAEHREELMGLLSHQEARQKDGHPLQRIMAVEENGNQVTITTTDIHLARDLGTALHSAYQGELEFHYNLDEYLLRVHWNR